MNEFAMTVDRPLQPFAFTESGQSELKFYVRFLKVFAAQLAPKRRTSSLSGWRPRPLMDGLKNFLRISVFLDECDIDYGENAVRQELGMFSSELRLRDYAFPEFYATGRT